MSFSQDYSSLDRLDSIKLLKNEKYQKIKENDTIYIEYKGIKNSNKNMSKSKSGIETRFYNFFTNKIDNVYFAYQSKNPDNEISQPVEVNKKFIKNHKKEIIDFNFLEIIKTPSSRLFSTFIKKQQRKIIYIIDYTEIKNKLLFMYKVKFTYNTLGDD